MANPSVRSLSTVAVGDSGNVVFAKPAGLAVGDVLLAFVTAFGGWGYATPPDGWTALDNPENASKYLGTYWRVATSDDVAAENFTWGGAGIAGGILYAIESASTVEYHAGGTFNYGTGHIAGFTPALAGDLLVVANYNSADSSPTPAIADDSLTWTQDDSDSCFSCYHALYPSADETGDFTSAMGGYYAAMCVVAVALGVVDPTYFDVDVTIEVPVPAVDVWCEARLPGIYHAFRYRGSDPTDPARLTQVLPHRDWLPPHVIEDNSIPASAIIGGGGGGGVNADWDASSGVAEILNKPVVPDAWQVLGYTAPSGGQPGDMAISEVNGAIWQNQAGTWAAIFIPSATFAWHGLWESGVEYPYAPQQSIVYYEGCIYELVSEPSDWTTPPNVASWYELVFTPLQADWDASSGVAEILNKPTSMTPTAHAATHHTGGSDALAPADIGAATAAALSSEVTRAETAEGTNATAIAGETTRAEAAEALLAPKASPALTGTPTAPTAAALDASTKVATTAYADSAVGAHNTAATPHVGKFDAAGVAAAETTRAEAAEALLAPLASPALTGSPTAPTQTAGDSSTKVATDAFVQTACGLLVPKSGGAMTGALAMGANKITGLANGSAAQDAATFGQIPGAATDSVAGLMSAADKTVLDNIQNHWFSVYPNTGVAFAANVWKQIVLDGIAHNDGSAFAANAYTVPVSGVYQFTGDYLVAATAAGVCEVALYIGSSIARWAGGLYLPAGGVGAIPVNVTMALTAVQVVTFYGIIVGAGTSVGYTGNSPAYSMIVGQYLHP